MIYSKFQKLTPTDNVDLTGYREAFEFIFENKDIRNVAISGAYSSGKSSLLESYKKLNKDKKFVHISLAHFGPEIKKQDDNGKPINNETIIEGKILNQLIQQIPEERIPQTDFRIKKSVKDKRVLCYTTLILVFALLVLFITKFEKWTTFVGNMEESFVKKFLQLTTEPNSLIFAGIVLMVILGGCIYWFLTIQKSKNILRKLSFQGNEIEIFSENENSYFDKYLNEVLYLFENADFDVFVFEDIDRFNTISIFERLREINTLVNIRLAGKRTVRFFYLLRDDMFSNKDRTKFFDYILPVVPVVDSSNSYNKLKEYLLYADMYKEFDDRFLRDLSLYIDDLRLLKNIINEFLIYYEKLKKIDLNVNKMLALVTYKNIFPKDFSELQLNKGFVYSLFEKKEILISNEKENIENKISECRKRRQNCENEMLESMEELKLVLNNKSTKSSQTGNYALQQQLKREYEQWKNDTYPIREMAIKDKMNNGRVVIERELEELKEQLKKIKSISFAEIINRSNIDSVFQLTTRNEIGVENNYEEIKTNEYFPLLKFLMRNGYLDESYNDYMTFFYENSLTRRDKLFLRSIADRKAKEHDYKLDNPRLVLSNLRETDFWQEECLNYSLISYLLNPSVDSKFFEAFMSQIKKTDNIAFLVSLYDQEQNRERLVELINRNFPDFFKKLLKGYLYNEEMLQEYSFYSLDNSSLDVLENMNEGGVFKEYIEGQNRYYSLHVINIERLIIILKSLDVRFENVSFTENELLLRKIYEDNIYKLNYENIHMFLNAMYTLDADEVDYTKCLTMVFSESEQPLCKYVCANMDEAVSAVLVGTDGTIRDNNACILDVLNSDKVSDENKLLYMERLSTKIDNIEEILDARYRVEAIKTGKAKCTVENIISYYDIEKLSDILISFINESSAELDFSSYEFKSATVKNAFFKECVATSKLNDEKYRQMVSSLKIKFPNFNIKNMEESKVQILINEDIIQMNANDLNFIRREYPKCMQNYVEKNIEKYFSVVGANPPLEEIKCALTWNIPTEKKSVLLGKTSEKISVFEKNYPEDIKVMILEAHLKPEDIPGLLVGYSGYGLQLKEKVKKVAKNQFGKVIAIAKELPMETIFELLADPQIPINSRRDLLSNTVGRMEDIERVQALKSINATQIAKLFEPNKKPKIVLDEENRAVLNILQESHIILGYEEDLEKNIFKVLRRKKRTSELKTELL